MEAPVSTPAAPASEPEQPDKKAWAQKVIEEILQLMGIACRLELKDGEDGSISVALMPEAEFPQLPSGKRSQVVDSLQLIVNKIVNRAGTPKRWVNLAVGGHPVPRPQRPAPVPLVMAPATSAPPPVNPPRPQQPARQVSAGAGDERTVQVSEDAALTQAARALAQKSAQFGRYLALWPIKLDDRARVLQACADIPGVKLHVEGEGRNRRVVFTPEKPTPMPKQGIIDYGDDEEDEA